MQLIRQLETSTVNHWPLQHDTNTVITLNNFMTSVYLFTPRNDKRWIIRVDGSSICLKQLSFHFRIMRRSSRGSACRPFWSTRLRLTLKAIRRLHKSCASSITQVNEIKTTLSNVQKSWTNTSISQLNATLPGQNAGPTWLLFGCNSSDFEPVITSDNRTSFHASNTREFHNIQQILTHLLLTTFKPKSVLSKISTQPISICHLFTLCIHGNVVSK